MCCAQYFNEKQKKKIKNKYLEEFINNFFASELIQ